MPLDKSITRKAVHLMASDAVAFTANDSTLLLPEAHDVEDALIRIRSLFPVLNEPTGFPNRTDSILSWVGGTRTFTITPSSTSFDYFIAGSKYTVTAADSIVIADTGGVHIIYYDGSTLSETVNPVEETLDDLWVNKAICGIVYWNTTDGAAYILADERHGSVMSGETHHWLHDNIGATWAAGLTLSGYTEDTASDAALTFEVSDGEFADQDLEHDIEDGSAANQYEQQLNGGDAVIPILFRDDIDGSWTEEPPTTLPYLTVAAGRLAYNKDDGDGTFSQVEVTDNRFVSATLIATNDWQYPIKMVQGQNEYTDKKTALEEASAEIIAWGNMPSPEFVVLYRFVMHTKDTFGSTPKCKIVAGGVVDFRRSGLTGASAIAQAHSNLTGIMADDHHDETHSHLQSSRLYISGPGSSEDQVFYHTPVAITISRIYAETDVGTATLKIKWRAEGGIFTGGTEVHGTSLVADATGEEQTAGFADATIPAGSVLAVQTSAVSGSPTELLVVVEYTPD